jgi:hypothetical protein
MGAQEDGFGTSGRNAGFAIDLPHDTGADDYIGDIDIARSTLKLNRLGQTKLHSQAEAHGIDCHMRPSGKYQAAMAWNAWSAINDSLSTSVSRSAG